MFANEEPKRSELPSSLLCQWIVRDDPVVDDRYTLGVVFFPEAGLDRVVANGEKIRLTLGARRAVQSLRGAGGGCAVSIEVTPTSRVDVQTTGQDGRALCPAAKRAAELVEPEIP